MTTLPEPIEIGLADIADRFDRAGVGFWIGGSLMVRLSGLDVAVHDIDVVVARSARDEVVDAMHGIDLIEPPTRDPWRSAWFLQAKMPTAAGLVKVDLVGEMALMIDGECAVFPADPTSFVSVAGLSLPLGSLAQWYHLYRVHDPAKAEVIAGRLSDEEIIMAAEELGIASGFSPTLIVRIGNETTAERIESGMSSSEAKSTIIEVASPTDQTFDEPDSANIDSDLLEETLEYIRPALQADGGDLVLLGTEGGKVTLQLVGACGGCPLSTMTLTAGIERIVMDRVPGVTEVVAL